MCIATIMLTWVTGLPLEQIIANAPDPIFFDITETINMIESLAISLLKFSHAPCL